MSIEDVFKRLTLYSAKTVRVLHRIIWSWYTARWWVGCYIWYSEDGLGDDGWGFIPDPKWWTDVAQTSPFQSTVVLRLRGMHGGASRPKGKEGRKESCLTPTFRRLPRSIMHLLVAHVGSKFCWAFKAWAWACELLTSKRILCMPWENCSSNSILYDFRFFSF